MLSDFDLKHEKKQGDIDERRFIRLIANHDNIQSKYIIEHVYASRSFSLKHKHTMLLSYRRFLVEDFNVLQKDTTVIVLTPFKPKCLLHDGDSFYKSTCNKSLKNY